MTTFTVNTLNDSDPNDGKLSLREALTQANATTAADTITFAAGLEGRTLVLTQGQLNVTNDVTITGDPDHDGIGVTIDQRTDGVADVYARVLGISGAGTDATLDGVVLTGGKGEGLGGGVLVAAGSGLALTNVELRQNAALYDSSFWDHYGGRGGNIFAATGSYLRIENSIIAQGQASYGAGICADGALVNISRSQIMNNMVLPAQYKGGYGRGGGLHFTQCSTSIVQSTVANNHSYSGGGLYARAGALAIVSSTIAGNSLSDDYYGSTGGGIALRRTDARIENTTFTGNTNDDFLDDISSSYGVNVTLSNSIVAGRLYTFSLTPTTFVSNGHNLIGSTNVAVADGDVVGVDPAKLFWKTDAAGGGVLVLENGAWVVPLRDALDNPALSGADAADGREADQIGAPRAMPVGSNPDIGAYELRQTHLSTKATAGNDVLTGNANANTLAGQAGADLLLGLAGKDKLGGGAGGDTLQGGLGDDRLDGGTGNDTASWRDMTGAVQASLVTGKAGGAGGADTLVSIENLSGGGGGDTLVGNSGRNALAGFGGADRLEGGAGNDSLMGGAGDDTLLGGRGDDFLGGGAGIDTASYADSTSAVHLDLTLSGPQDTGWGLDQLVGIENLTGGALADRLVGNDAANRLTGGSGADTLLGGVGNDVLTAGTGSDSTSGGSGNDIFDFGTAADSGLGSNADWITDFTGVGATVADRIDLADVYAGALVFKGTSAFSGINQVRVMASGSDTIVQVNLSGTTAPEMEIRVQDGVATPGQWAAGDFIL